MRTYYDLEKNRFGSKRLLGINCRGVSCFQSLWRLFGAVTSSLLRMKLFPFQLLRTNHTSTLFLFKSSVWDLQKGGWSSFQYPNTFKKPTHLYPKPMYPKNHAQNQWFGDPKKEPSKKEIVKRLLFGGFQLLLWEYRNWFPKNHPQGKRPATRTW